MWRCTGPARRQSPIASPTWIGTLAVLALLAAGCSSSSGGGGGGGGDPTSRSYVGTQSPGYLWSFQITESTWEGSNETVGFTFSGTVETMENQFLLFTVTASDDPETPTDGSARAFALEVPGVVLMLQPDGDGDSQMIVGVAEGDCPTEDGSYNWITIPQSGWNSEAHDAFGTASFAWSGSTATINVQPSLLSGSSLDPFAGSATCADGFMDLDDVTMGVTEAGTVIGNQNEGDGGGFVGIAQPGSNVGTAALTASGIEYRGLVFEYEREGQDTQPVWARRSSSGVLLAGSYDDFESNAENTAETALVNLTTESIPGRVSGTVEDGDPQDIVFAVGEVDGRYFIFGIGNAVAATSPYNVLLIQVE